MKQTPTALIFRRATLSPLPLRTPVPGWPNGWIALSVSGQQHIERARDWGPQASEHHPVEP